MGEALGIKPKQYHQLLRYRIENISLTPGIIPNSLPPRQGFVTLADRSIQSANNLHTILAEEFLYTSYRRQLSMHYLLEDRVALKYL